MKLTTLTGAGALLLLTLSPTQASAESFATCTGYITSVPAVISTQGTWCLSKDVASPMQNGTLIDVVVNNVAIDCNGFKVGGLAAGKGTNTTGISARNRLNVAVRNCNIRGFKTGIDMSGAVVSGGHLVERNRLDNMTQVAVNIEGGGSLVRENVITGIGGTTTGNFSRAMQVGADVDVMGNLIDGVFPGNGTGESTPSAIGIFLYSTGAVIRDNRIRNIDAGEGGEAYGILAVGDGLNRAANNDLFGMNMPNSIGIECSVFDNVSLSDNYIGGFEVGYKSCGNDGNNTIR
jgi:hypothetical protein